MLVCFIVNPTKLSDQISMRSKLLDEARKLGWDARWFTSDPDDGGIAATEAALGHSPDVVCAVGGDGTVRAVASVLRGTHTPLGLLPAGTGNLLARNLGVPLGDLSRALKIALAGKQRPIDVGVMAIRHRLHIFLVAAGIGLDAEIMTSTDEGLKRQVGWLAYIVSGARSLFRRGFSAAITVDDDNPMKHRARMILVCNCASLMGGVHLAPEAAPDDGQLDLAIFRPKGLFGWGVIVFRVLTRRHRASGPLTYHAGGKFSVWLGGRVPAEADGDYITDACEAHFHIERRNLLVRVP